MNKRLVYAVEPSGDVNRFDSESEAARHYRLNHSTISRSLKRTHYFGVKCVRFFNTYPEAIYYRKYINNE